MARRWRGRVRLELAEHTSFTIRSTSVPSETDTAGSLEFDNIEVSPVPEGNAGPLAVAALLGLLARRGSLDR